jgi:hypothetical protein
MTQSLKGSALWKETIIGSTLQKNYMLLVGYHIVLSETAWFVLIFFYSNILLFHSITVFYFHSS